MLLSTCPQYEIQKGDILKYPRITCNLTIWYLRFVQVSINIWYYIFLLIHRQYFHRRTHTHTNTIRDVSTMCWGTSRKPFKLDSTRQGNLTGVREHSGYCECWRMVISRLSDGLLWLSDGGKRCEINKRLFSLIYYVFGNENGSIRRWQLLVSPEGICETIVFTFGVCLFVCVCVSAAVSPINTWRIPMKLRIEIPVLHAYSVW